MTISKILIPLTVLLASVTVIYYYSGRPSVSETEIVNETPSGKKIYEAWGCGTCHGNNGAGGPRGPLLKGLSEYWQPQTLTEYLKNPTSYRSRDERLGKLAKRYFPLSMPAFEDLDLASNTALANYLLSL